jgi:hypothetical protein
MAIMAHALKTCLVVPRAIGYVFSAVIVIPLVAHGLTLMSRFQTSMQSVRIVLHLLAFAFITAQGCRAVPRLWRPDLFPMLLA